MARSMKIGHCVCAPRRPCPCPLFIRKNVCTCAGEREPPDDSGEPVRLTRYVKSAGCAGKIGQADLHDVLKNLPPVEDPRVLVGMETGDDAGVFRLSDALAIVQTVDVLAPMVDEPYLFGRIAACNSLSDVYAMGGRPLTALSVIGFPIHLLPPRVMGEIMRGGMDVLGEAGTILLGGHSLEDEEIKFGFAVTGVVDPARIISNAGARPGDLLILTKPIGTGIVSFTRQVGKAALRSIEAAESSMTALNRAASEIMVRAGATACTDVTGFGLLGHLAQIAIESKMTAELWFDDIPLLPGVLEYADQGYYPGANERNADFSARLTDFDPDIRENQKAVLFDPQTSGGLLISLPAGAAVKALEELHRAGCEDAAVIGRIAGPSDGRIRILAGGAEKQKADTGQSTRERAGRQRETESKETYMTAGEEKGCCEDSHDADSHAGSPMDRFNDFLGSVTKPGAVDVVTKELIAIALGLAVNCVKCAKAHIVKAKGMGISAKEIEEAAAIAVAFSGCRTMMLWNDLKKELLEG